MKDIKHKIFEAHQSLVSEVQNEYDKDYAYQTFNYSDGQKKYDYGFLVFNNDQEFFSVTAFNKNSEEAEEFAGECDIDLEELMDLKVGQSYDDNGHGPQYVVVITRIW